MQGKYEALHRRLTELADNEWHATFRDVEAVLGTSLPRSARRHQAWWSNTTSHSHARAWLWAGWQTRDVNLDDGTLSFVRTGNDRLCKP